MFRSLRLLALVAVPLGAQQLTGFTTTRDSVLQATPAKGATTKANAALMQVERPLTHPALITK